MAVAVALGGALAAPRSADAAKSGQPAAMKLDESKLPPFNQFRIGDLDASKSACSDFSGHVNGKWLAGNAIPGDRVSWGAFEMLAERSVSAQRQLAEQAAKNPKNTGVEKIVGDFWATGMDEAKINAQGIAPLKSRLAEIDALTNGASVAEYLRMSFGRGEGAVFGFGPSADFKDSSMNIAYVAQGGLGLPDVEYYRKDEHKEKLAAYEKHIAKVLELSGVAAADAAKQAKDVIAFEIRLAKASKSSEELSRDVSLFYNPVSPADADKMTPNFSWTRFFESQGIAAPKMFSFAIPEF
ncbi:MAG: peptidase, partial [Xanthomonadaceae bacterium]|nr:peptidase [Xanthomonadaceae bacterium]